MAELTPIPVASLLIDTKNPRFLHSNAGQREALRESARHQEGKLIALASDIVSYGLSPIEVTMVMRQPGKQNRYVVLEGNRRLVALRSLERPELLDEVIPARMLSMLRRLSEQYLKNPIPTIDCYLTESRAASRHWIELRHGGLMSGAGIFKWGSEEGERFRSRSGALRLHSQVLDFLEDRGDITPAVRRAVPPTSFRRLMETPEVATASGVQLRKGEMLLLAPEDKAAKVLRHIVNQLATKEIKTKDIYTAEQRREYAKNLPAGIAIASKVKPERDDDRGKPDSKVEPPAVSVRSTKPRDRLIPVDCSLHITDPRLAEIAERELKRLSLEAYSNAVSVLFRVFVELSCDAYISDVEGVEVSPKIKPEDLSLTAKLNAVVGDLRKRNELNHQQAEPVRRAAQSDSYLAPSVRTMHGYLHNRFSFPPPGDLRRHWDSLQPFFVALWSVHAREKKTLASKKSK